MNHKYFNLSSSQKLPSIILTSKGAAPITRFSIEKTSKEDPWVSITSTKPIGNEIVDDLFINGNKVLDHMWIAAYPVFKPIKKIPSTYLANNLYYNNAIESVTSNLETSVFSALNCIKRIKKKVLLSSMKLGGFLRTVQIFQ